MSNMSSLEQKVYDLLNKGHISFEREKVFKDCYNGLYRYDFYLPELNTVLEINGSQHYTYVKRFYKNKSEFLKAQERDRRKISYALARGLKIYCIPYWEIDKIYTAADLFKPQFLAKNRWKNDKDWQKHKI